MKRFACHRLYLSPDKCFTHYVVELRDDGKVQTYYPLEEEICATQWIGGAIVLSAKAEAGSIMAKEDFRTFLSRITRVDTNFQECYAWHITDFDIVQEEFIPHSRITRL